ncbi:MAG: aminoacyl-tRNA hydrolase [Candidatus Nomurabacteria bacterium]|nr:MAG: aminoacyl-tRNA hydrolase [Candidatus Nomurabacteria bacterium]
MKCIVGLGNPGTKYDDTRHNLGFALVDAIVEHLELAPFQEQSKFKAEMTRNDDPIHHWFFMKPQTYMNNSGEAVGEFVRFYKLPLNDLLVIHDDLDLPFGEIKHVVDRGPAGHNGVQSIIDVVGSQAFHRIRIGIGSNKELGIPSEDYVLQKFNTEEKQKISELLEPVLNIILNWA